MQSRKENEPSGVIVLFAGFARIQSLMDWVLDLGVNTVRVGGVAGFIFGGLLIILFSKVNSKQHTEFFVLLCERGEIVKKDQKPSILYNY